MNGFPTWVPVTCFLSQLYMLCHYVLYVHFNCVMHQVLSQNRRVRETLSSMLAIGTDISHVLLFNIYFISFKCISELKDDIACSHMRVLDLFIESIISSCKFQSVPCVSKSNFANGRCSHCGNGCAYMGYKSQHNIRGKFFLTTNSGPPYCLH